MSKGLGIYHQRWRSQPPWIELYVDQIASKSPRWALWLPLVTRVELAHTLYHEIGHHTHCAIRPEYKEREDVADEWRRKLGKKYLRRRYWYMILFAKLVRLFWRK